jgi:uncharacterized protein YutE (UPF0331/DUF86 family)
MTRDVLNQKIDSLRNCIERIESKKPFDVTELTVNFDLQDIVSINLERAVQVCVDIASHVLAEKQGPSPSTMAESFVELSRAGIISAEVSQSMVKAVGLRNLLVHEYSKINWKIVSDVANLHLDSFREFAKEILQKV